jgi:hypothetical protein
MALRLRFLVVPSLAALTFLVSNRALAQSYGLGDQVLTISAADFHPYNSSTSSFFYEDFGYLSGNGDFIAAINLPDGASITQVCLDAFLFGSGIITFAAQTHGLPLSPGLAPTTEIWAEGQTDFANFGSTCSTPPPHTVHSVFDAGNGLKSYRDRIVASLGGDVADLGGVRITWHRQVSAAPASSSFGDVSASDGAFQFIEALVASGVTAGCGGGNYCPDAPLTRRQMAVFLSKALGLHWPN